MKEVARVRPVLRQFRVYQLLTNKLSLACVSVRSDLRVFNADFFPPTSIKLIRARESPTIAWMHGGKKKLTRRIAVHTRHR